MNRQESPGATYPARERNILGIVARLNFETGGKTSIPNSNFFAFVPSSKCSNAVYANDFTLELSCDVAEPRSGLSIKAI